MDFSKEVLSRRGAVLGLLGSQGHGHLSWCSHFFLPGAREVTGKSQVRFLFQRLLLLLLPAQLTEKPGINISIDLSINIQIFGYIYLFF